MEGRFRISTTERGPRTLEDGFGEVTLYHDDAASLINAR
jgi:hypothetical protein